MEMKNAGLKFVNGPLNILEVGTKTGEVLRFNNVLKHDIKYNNESRCYEIYFQYFDEGNMKTVYSTVIMPLNDMELITCTSLHDSKRSK